MSGSFTTPELREKSSRVILVKGDQKLANQFKIKGAPAMLIVTADGDELFRGSVTSAAAVSAGLDKALASYTSAPISWSAEPAPSSKPFLVVAFDKEGQENLKVLEDRMLVKYHKLCQFVRFPFERGSALAKKWKAYSAPTILICDAGSENPEKKPFVKIQGKKRAASLRMYFKKALLKVERLKR